MRVVLITLGVVLVALLGQNWLSDGGLREVWRLERAVEEQREMNAQLRERNRELEAEVNDLKKGRDAIEERARAELGMKRDNETFYQIVETPGPQK